MLFRVLRKLSYVAESAFTLRILNLLLGLLNAPKKPYYQSVKNSLLYVSASCMPYHLSGYTVRTQSLLKAMQDAGFLVCAHTRPGYPWDRPDSLIQDVSEPSTLMGIEYWHARKPTRYRPIIAYTLQGAYVIKGAAQKKRTAVIHAASNYANALPALFAARRLGVPFHYEMRGLWELTRISRHPDFETTAGYRLGLSLEAFVAQNADHVYVISTALSLYVQQNLGVDADKISLLPNCVDPDAIMSSTIKDIEPMTIGYAGSLINYEGLDTLLDAVALLYRKGISIQLKIIGDGEAYSDLENQARLLGLKDSVNFLGRLPPDESKAVLRSCALVCLPRKPYTVCKLVPPYKLVEALALGKAIVVPDLPVFRNELGDEAPALFFESGNANDLAQVIASAINDVPELVKLGQRARRYAENNRNWRKFL